MTPFSPDLFSFLEKKGVPFIGFDGVNVEGFSSRSTATMRLARRLTVARYILGRVVVFARPSERLLTGPASA